MQRSDDAARVTDATAAGAPATCLRRQMGLGTATAVVVASMIGQMIFTSSGFLANDLKHPLIVLAVWLVGGVHALLGALCYAELGTLLPRAGGEYAYLRVAYGPPVGFLSGWASFLAGFSAPLALCAIAFFEYAATFVPALHPRTGLALTIPLVSQPVPLAQLAAAGLILALTAFHYVRVSSGVHLGNLLTALKAGAIVLLIVAAAASGVWDTARLVTGAAVPPPRELLPLAGTGLMFITLAYAGWNAAGYIAGEVENPRRVLPRAAVFGTLLVTAIYLAVNVLYFAVLPLEGIEPAPNIANLAAGACFGGAGEKVISAVVMLVQLASISALVLTGSRIYYAMGADGVAWKGLARVSGAQATPRVAVALQGLVAAVMALTASFWTLALYSAAILTVFSALAVGSVLILRRRLPGRDAYRAPLGPLLPLGYLAITAVVLVFWGLRLADQTRGDPDWKDLKLTGIWALSILAGLPVYWFFTRRAGKR